MYGEFNNVELLKLITKNTENNISIYFCLMAVGKQHLVHIKYALLI